MNNDYKMFEAYSEDGVMTPEDRAWIITATLSELLYRNRYEASETCWFRGARGDYHLARLKELRDLDPGGYVAASKEIGW